MTHAQDMKRLHRSLYPGRRAEPRCPHTYDLFEDTMDEGLIEKVAIVIDPMCFTALDGDDEHIIARNERAKEAAKKKAVLAIQLIWDHFRSAAEKAIMETPI